MTDATTRIAQEADRIGGSIEAALVAVGGRAATWLASVPVAVLTARATEAIFAIPPFWAAVTSIALELVGMATGQLWVTLRDWNARKRASDPKAPAYIALALMLVYFGADFALIATLEAPRILAGEIEHLASLLFPTMAAVGVVVLNQRVTHYRRVAAVEQAKADARQRREERQREKEREWRSKEEEAQRQAEFEKAAAGIGNAMDTALWFAANPGGTHADAAQDLGIQRRTVSYHLQKAEAAGVIERDDGVVRLVNFP